MTQKNATPVKNPEPDDPLTLTGVRVPGGLREAEDMAYTFAEEFAQLGYSEEQLIEMFRSPAYRAPNDAYRLLGEDMIHSIVCECAEVWGRFSVSHVEVKTECGGVSGSCCGGGTHDETSS